MALPNMAVPTFKTKIPSTGKEVQFRPFLVKEEKILLMALEGGDIGEMTDATKKIIQSCLISEVDVDSLATFDVEYLFMQLRGKSVGELIKMIVGHTGDNPCEHRTEVSINIDDIKVKGVKKDKKIAITDKIGVVVSYPTMKGAQMLQSEDPEAPFKLMASCIDMVYDADNVYDDFTLEEMVQWLEGLSKQQFEKITNFFQNIPKLEYKVEWTCPECKKKDSFVIEGLASFFM